MDFGQAKKELLKYLRSFKDKELKSIVFGLEVLSANDLILAVEQETEIGIKHIHMFQQTRPWKQKIVSTMGWFFILVIGLVTALVCLVILGP